MKSKKDIILDFYRQYVALMKKFPELKAVSINNGDTGNEGFYFTDRTQFLVELGEIESEEELLEKLNDEDNWL